jgi:F-type H+-transporting ATPase subunit epsilon
MALVVSENVDMVVVPGIDGDFGVLPGHSPVLTTIRPGLIKIFTNGEVTKSLFVEGGFAEANAKGCTVLAEGVTDILDISAEDAQARLAAARDAVTGKNGATKNEVKVAEAMVMAASGNNTQH